ncbi:MAG: hypothetical protein O9284_01210 [Steroidobacteraceae bacterium]|nr:hypothetical protein [Steroidobacteraceae bacterium]
MKPTAPDSAPSRARSLLAMGAARRLARVALAGLALWTLVVWALSA